MLYAMVTGAAPFAGESMLQVMYQHVAKKPKNPQEANPELPDYLAQIILRCLEKDPERRYQSAREILHNLEFAPLRHASSACDRGDRLSEVAARRDAGACHTCRTVYSDSL